MKPVEIDPAGLQTGPDYPPALPISAQKTSWVLPRPSQQTGIASRRLSAAMNF